jgi:DNA-binding Lrp family transcriptional regulator
MFYVLECIIFGITNISPDRLLTHWYELMALKIDKLDQQLISILQNNCDINIKILASLLNITQTPLRKRINKLRSVGYLCRYLGIDKSKFPNAIAANIGVSLKDHSDETFNLFEKEISEIESFINIQRVSGNIDYQLSFLFRDKNEKEDFLLNKITRVPGIRQFDCVDVLKEIHQRKFRFL